MQSGLPKRYSSWNLPKFAGIISKTAAGTNHCGGTALRYLSADRDRRFNKVPT
jgi:hypothetical protein